MRRLPFFFFAGASLVVSLVFAPCRVYAADESQRIRISLFEGEKEVVLGVRGHYTVLAGGSREVADEGKSLATKARVSKAGIFFGGKEWPAPSLSIVAEAGAAIQVNARRYRGSIDLVRGSGTRLMVVNSLGIDEYLYGVLNHEVSHLWPMEALKAQAVIARTFALYQKAQRKNHDYDVRSDIYSQVYGGRASERWRANRAVDLTKGLVLTWKGKLFPAYYHATCAGHTEDASRLWTIDLGPLKGVSCHWCVASPHYRWYREIPLLDIRVALNKNSHAVGKIASIETLSRNGSGRNDKIKITDERGLSIIVTAKDLRQLLDPNRMRSTDFTVSIENDMAVFKGSGWGHGVGLCQWGAYGMARNGKTMEEILAWYYPGSVITDLNASPVAP